MPETIHTVQLKIMQAVQYLAKQNQGDYSAVTEQQVMEALKPLLIEHQVTMCCTDVQGWDECVKSALQNGQLSTFTFTFDFRHVPSETRLTITVPGQAWDHAGKAAAMATTHAKKYALLMFALAITGDDPDTVRELAGTTEGAELSRYVRLVRAACTKADLDKVLLRATAALGEEAYAALVSVSEERKTELASKALAKKDAK